MPDPDTSRDNSPSSPWALTAVLSVMGIGVVFALAGHWRRAALLFSAAMLLGAGLRLVLPRRLAGLLVTRRRAFDVTVLGLIGLAIVVVTLVVPGASH